ncbi:MAG TPA: FHA domain-containing protein [Rhodanobacter sp.]|nr:FHA domain-containing protein [Rhodanobacter sp.]
MDNPRPISPAVTGKRSSGPQGTRLFVQEDLRQLAAEAGNASEGRPSVHKPVLESVSPELGGRRFSVHPGRQTIGRLASNNIVVNGPSVSSSHAWITNQQGRCIIVNTLSTNGTFVNDKRIHRATLRHGDRIRLGQIELVFLTRDHGSSGPRHLRRLAMGLAGLVGLGVLIWWLLLSPSR